MTLVGTEPATFGLQYMANRMIVLGPSQAAIGTSIKYKPLVASYS